uniref:Uncharacterized protein n=1 Tax=Anguilla anguilla TaxID=7936 RepID=A0A0E9QPN0_ANGAN
MRKSEACRAARLAQCGGSTGGR